MTSAIYLTGSTSDPTSWVGQMPEPDWRTTAMSKLQRYGLTVVNPLDLAWTSSELRSTFDTRVRQSLDLIDQCDALLANLIKPSYGSAMEIFYAHRRGKMVTVVGQSPFSPWVLSHSQARFEDVDRALDYLIGEKPQFDSVGWALQYESWLSEHYEQMPPDGEPDYRFLGGELPILVVAPHATGYWREGEFQEPDAFSGTMAALLHKLTGAHTLHSSYCCLADPGWYLETPMRRAFAEIVKSGKIPLVVFLLGSSWHESPGLHVDGWGSLYAEDAALRLRQSLSELEPATRSESSAQIGPLIRFAAEELGVSVVQVRMHKRYRMPRLQPEPFVRVLDHLAEFIDATGLEFLRSLS